MFSFYKPTEEEQRLPVWYDDEIESEDEELEPQSIRDVQSSPDGWTVFGIVFGSALAVFLLVIAPVAVGIFRLVTHRWPFCGGASDSNELDLTDVVPRPEDHHDPYVKTDNDIDNMSVGSIVSHDIATNRAFQSKDEDDSSNPLSRKSTASTADVDSSEEKSGSGPSDESPGTGPAVISESTDSSEAASSRSSSSSELSHQDQASVDGYEADDEIQKKKESNPTGIHEIINKFGLPRSQRRRRQKKLRTNMAFPRVGCGVRASKKISHTA